MSAVGNSPAAERLQMNVSAIIEPSARQSFSWFVFGLMASVTFVGILSELIPAGVLPQMTEGLGVSESRIGFLVGVYALAPPARSARPMTPTPFDNGIHRAHTMSFDQLDRCLDLITYNGAETWNVEEQYGIEPGKPANFLVPNADTPFEAVRQRADVLASVRHGEYQFKRPEPSYEIELDRFRKTT